MRPKNVSLSRLSGSLSAEDAELHNSEMPEMPEKVDAARAPNSVAREMRYASTRPLSLALHSSRVAASIWRTPLGNLA